MSDIQKSGCIDIQAPLRGTFFSEQLSCFKTILHCLKFTTVCSLSGLHIALIYKIWRAAYNVLFPGHQRRRKSPQLFLSNLHRITIKYAQVRLSVFSTSSGVCYQHHYRSAPASYRFITMCGKTSNSIAIGWCDITGSQKFEPQYEVSSHIYTQM